MQQRIKFAGPFKNNVLFDRNEISKKIIVPTFKQARRSADTYCALVKEFYEEGCPTSAKYFQILIDKERILYESASIRNKILDEPKLLLGLFDNCKMAEKAALLGECNGPFICSSLLLQCILLLENYNQKYDWILMDAFRIITRITANVCKSEEVSKESLCQIYYKFGMYLTKCDLEEAVKYLERSFDLARGTSWIHKESSYDGKFVHCSSLIAQTYASVLLDHANSIFRIQTQKALNQGQKAIIILTGDIKHNKGMYVKAYLDIAEFQLEATNYEASISILENIIKYIRPEAEDNLEFLKYLARYNHLKGVCFERTNKYDMALFELFEALKIVRQMHLKHEEGIILLDVAKVYVNRGRSQYRMAESCLRQSKEIFVTLNDMFNIKRTSYLMANLKVHNILPMILDLIKSFPTNICDKHRLIRWKSMCLPFWRNLRQSLEEEKRVHVQCLIKATEIPSKRDREKNVQRKAP